MPALVREIIRTGQINPRARTADCDLILSSSFSEASGQALRRTARAARSPSITLSMRRRGTGRGARRAAYRASLGGGGRWRGRPRGSGSWPPPAWLLWARGWARRSGVRALAPRVRPGRRRHVIDVSPRFLMLGRPKASSCSGCDWLPLLIVSVIASRLHEALRRRGQRAGGRGGPASDDGKRIESPSRQDFP